MVLKFGYKVSCGVCVILVLTHLFFAFESVKTKSTSA